jgi:glutamine amidotransferase
MIAVVDTGIGNVGAVANMLLKVGAHARVVDSPKVLTTAASAPDALILPGVGHFDAGMRRLTESGFADALAELALERRVPLLGICLGMQMLTRGSDEGSAPGLGWVAAHTRRFDFSTTTPRVVPHMGWSETHAARSGLFADFEAPPRFYYVHSFHVVCDAPTSVAATCRYGTEFTASIRQGNVFGTQFHPEKSHRFGMTLLGRFVAMARSGECSA